MKILSKLSHKNKIFFSSVAVIFLLSVGIALVARWVLISSLIYRLEQRGIGIAQSVAEGSKGYILTENSPELTNLVFDASLIGDREKLISYVFILDQEGKVLAHTFIDAFPAKLLRSNQVPPEQLHSIMLLQTGGATAYDIALPVQEGIYRIGTVHVGVNKKHIDRLISKLRITFFGFISAIVLIFFAISHKLSKYITRPMSKLIRMSDELSRGNLDVEPGIGTTARCWEMKGCDKSNCPAYKDTSVPCWYVDGTECGATPECSAFPEKLQHCYGCHVYKKHVGDEIEQLADSFNHTTRCLKASQVKLKESEEKYRSLSDSGPNPIFVLDRETLEILDLNPSAEETYGYSKEELTGRPFTDLGTFEYVEGGAEALKKDGSSRACALGSRILHYKKGNRPFYVDTRASATRYQDRDAIVLATNDITEIVEKDAQLIQASKMTSLGEMSAGIAHELNQPLNAIKMGNEFLKMMIEKKRNIPEEHLSEVVTQVSAQVDRAAETINRLREFGRKSDITKEKVDINKPIRGVLAIIAKQLGLQNIEVLFYPDETVSPILAHNNRLEQVIFNLVTNARDAINQRKEANNETDTGIVTIRSFEEGDRVAVTVTDTGIGIPEGAKEKIFEPFFTTKEVGNGMGLGLSILYEIVREYGGVIRVHSQEGIGSTFKLTFPRATS
ncbi:MAG: ATP-binding protein [Desulfobacteraceae bacterium]|nr:ATP-binding protein [Desulfobacteraceae bacterium]